MRKNFGFGFGGWVGVLVLLWSVVTGVNGRERLALLPLLQFRRFHCSWSGRLVLEVQVSFCVCFRSLIHQGAFGTPVPQLLESISSY